MTGLIMGTVEFEPLVMFSCDDSDLCLTLAAITHRALRNSIPFVSSRIVIFRTLLLPEANISVKLLQVMPWILHQAALLHKILHESVNFMIDLCWLQHGIFSVGPPLDFNVFEVRTVLARLARRLVELLLNIGIGFGFGSSCIRLAMAGARH